MSDKSPRQSMTKKSGKSLKEKRADKHAKAAAKEEEETKSAVIRPLADTTYDYVVMPVKLRDVAEDLEREPVSV